MSRSTQVFTKSGRRPLIPLAHSNFSSRCAAWLSSGLATVFEYLTRPMCHSRRKCVRLCTTPIGCVVAATLNQRVWQLSLDPRPRLLLMREGADS